MDLGLGTVSDTGFVADPGIISDEELRKTGWSPWSEGHSLYDVLRWYGFEFVVPQLGLLWFGKSI